MRISFVLAILVAATVSLASLSADARTDTERRNQPAAVAEKTEPTQRALSPARQAMLARQKTCAAEWKTAKGTKAAQGVTWPKFWSACNTRLKEKQG